MNTASSVAIEEFMCFFTSRKEIVAEIFYVSIMDVFYNKLLPFQNSSTVRTNS